MNETMNTTNEISTCSTEQMIPQICRLCAQESYNYVSIFDENNFYVAEKISRCLSIVVFPMDNLPSHVCKRCLHYLNISYKLIVISQRADIELRERLESQTYSKQLQDSKLRNSNGTKPISKPRNPGHMSLKELRKRAIAGPANCELCNICFDDLDEFDDHMESLHLRRWRCNLCDVSFKKSAELVTHKTLNHDGNIVVCNTCVQAENEKIELQAKRERFKEREKLKSAEDNAAEVQEEIVLENLAKVSENESKSKCRKSKKRNVKRILTLRGLKNSPCSTKTCEICKISFGDERCFIGHRKIHEPKRIVCVTCRSEHSSIYHLFLHKRSEHNMYKKVQLKYVCNKCGKFFTNSWQWESHNGKDCPKMHLENVCKYCNSSFSTNHKLSRHLRRHKAEMFDDPTVPKYTCVSCPKVFVDREFYEKHRNVHDPECQDKFRCPLCRRCFRDNVRLKEHKLSIHEGIKPHQCDVCGKSFHRLSNMKVHRALHFGHKCKHCDSTFEKTRDLASHSREAHGIEQDLSNLPKKVYKSGCYVCRFCGKRLATCQSLLDHEHIHTGEKPYTCKICHKTFRSYTARWAHIQRHEKGNYVCEHCGKCFSYKQNLSVHIQTHAPVEERKHLCSRCGKRFLRKCQLNVHMRIHDGIRPYICDICYASFTQIGDMKRHRTRHTKGEFRMKKSRQRQVYTNDKN